MKKYYHATPAENLDSILENGLVSESGFIYLTEKFEECIPFIALRGVNEILVVELEVPEENVGESFDHSQKFFQCRAFVYKGSIPLGNLIDFKMVQIGVK